MLSICVLLRDGWGWSRKTTIRPCTNGADARSLTGSEAETLPSRGYFLKDHDRWSGNANAPVYWWNRTLLMLPMNSNCWPTHCSFSTASRSLSGCREGLDRCRIGDKLCQSALRNWGSLWSVHHQSCTSFWWPSACRTPCSGHHPENQSGSVT